MHPSSSLMALSCTAIPSLVLLLCFQGAIAAKFTFVNNCEQTVWPGILGTPTLDATGFELTKGTSRTFQAPTGWSGRFWGRTGCNFDDSGQGSCLTGDCGSGQMECNGEGAQPPATLAEFTLGAGGSQDFYDVSLVDGFNLPMMVDVSGGGSGRCAPTGCGDDLNLKCPAELRTEGGRACRSACDAFKTPQYCCSGAYASPSTCSPSVYSQIFKSVCPKSYSYAYDDTTSTFTCTDADYIITFCPPSSSSASKKGSNSSTTVGSGSGSEPAPESGSGAGAAVGTGETAMLADGTWLASLATGDSTTIHPFTAIQFLFSIIALVVLHNLFMLL
nr:thaumatin-like protein 1 [Ipomoea trifida]